MKWLRNLLRTPPTTRPAPRKARPRLEVLEDRTVPTVLIQPHFSGTHETSSSSVNQYTLQNEAIDLIFAGPYWKTQQGRQDEKTLIKDVKIILGSTYLTGLEQYGFDGQAGLYKTMTASKALALNGDFPDGSTLLNYVQKKINNNPYLTPPASSGKQPLYFVINGPGDSAPGYTYGLNWNNGTLFTAYVGAEALADGSLDVGGFTECFSHELAEATANCVVVSDPGNLQAGTQICDNEPEDPQGNAPGYVFAVNGVMVQAYWSQQDGAWIVPGAGGSGTTTLNPIWTGKTFTGF
jgi:hypothetical protein